MSKIDDEKTLQYIAGFKRYSTERVMKSLVGEFTQNEKWSVKGVHMGNVGIRIAVCRNPHKLWGGGGGEGGEGREGGGRGGGGESGDKFRKFME